MTTVKPATAREFKDRAFLNLGLISRDLADLRGVLADREIESATAEHALGDADERADEINEALWKMASRLRTLEKRCKALRAAGRGGRRTVVGYAITPEGRAALAAAGLS